MQHCGLNLKRPAGDGKAIRASDKVSRGMVGAGIKEWA